MLLRLREVRRDDAIVVLEAPLPADATPQQLDYATRTGALLRLDDAVAGAFDREHGAVVVAGAGRERRVTLEVERQSLPTNGLPSGPGVSWWLMNALSHPRPTLRLTLCHPEEPERGSRRADGIQLIGHSHLDVAWLWTYEQSRRKALRTFAIALELMARDPAFVFVQSQPQLYHFVQEDDPELFERVRGMVHAGRFDADVAALWVESDCNLPSGESLLRQMLAAHHYCEREFGMSPSIAWLPDTFGFPNTLPTLLGHAGIRRFLTTKLEWNDTTRFPFPQFRWCGPDGSEVAAALAASYDGGVSAARVAVARERREPLIAGYGDGGGGVTDQMLADARAAGTWIRPRDWFRSLEARFDWLPLHADELYLEYHRGVYTTHHDMKSSNAAMERALAEAEELVSWCTALRISSPALAAMREQLHAAWEIVLRNQFHDVLPGSSTAEVYADSRSEYERCERLVGTVRATAQAFLPRAARPQEFTLCEPLDDGDAAVFESDVLRVRVSSDGTIRELSAKDGRNLVARANELRAYRDRPREWEAWNVDAGYDTRSRPVSVSHAGRVDGGFEVTLAAGSSPAMMRVTLGSGEPFVRVEFAIDWRERRTLLRLENQLAFAAERVTYGTPHGTIERSTLSNTPQERAKFEVPGQRFASSRDEGGAGVAIFALDTYGWNARAGDRLHLGHSLLRGTCWPDPNADRGLQQLSWAFMPLAGATIGDLERAWQLFAHDRSVKLFRSDRDNVLVVACKPAEDGDGVIVRVRECDGAGGELRLRCGARMREAHASDALERPLPNVDVRIEAETLISTVAAFGLRSFRVCF